MTAPTTTRKPASDKQLALIANLLGEKLISDEAQAVIDDKYAGYRDSSKTASGFISFLFTMPRVDGGANPTARFDPEPGVYRMDDTIYRVRVSRAGHWYAEKCVKPGDGESRKSVSWDYCGKRVNLRTATVVSDAEAGQFLGYCIRCNAELTDPDSIARGLGPVCAQKA